MKIDYDMAFSAIIIIGGLLGIVVGCSNIVYPPKTEYGQICEITTMVCKPDTRPPYIPTKEELEQAEIFVNTFEGEFRYNGQNES